MQELMVYSRVCRCHVPDLASDESYEKMLRRETGHATCPAAGLCAPELAAGIHREILDSAYQKGYHAVLNSLIGVSPEGKERIQGDYELGMNLFIYIINLKFEGSWMQLPLLCAALGHRDEAKARAAAWEVARQCAP